MKQYSTLSNRAVADRVIPHTAWALCSFIGQEPGNTEVSR
jgi:hypothetical protein